MLHVQPLSDCCLCLNVLRRMCLGWCMSRHVDLASYKKDGFGNFEPGSMAFCLEARAVSGRPYELHFWAASKKQCQEQLDTECWDWHEELLGAQPAAAVLVCRALNFLSPMPGHLDTFTLHLRKMFGVRTSTVSYGIEPLSVFQLATLSACIAYSSITKGNFIDPGVVLNLK